jgi:predicted nucleic acid-binding Zn ribbon protein
MQLFSDFGVLVRKEYMSATRLNVRWMEPETGQSLPGADSPPGLLVRVGVEPNERRCPVCDSIVYTRRHKWCGACGEALPASCLFTPDEAEKVNALLRRERQRHRDWIKKTQAA